MIDFEKQPLCEHCCFCVGWAYPRGEQECSAGVAYKDDGSCRGHADFIEQQKLDAQEYDYDESEEEDDDDYYEEEEEPEEEQEDEE